MIGLAFGLVPVVLMAAVALTLGIVRDGSPFRRDFWSD